MKFDLLPGRRVEWFDSVDSTMTVAARLAREGCPSGTMVGADTQTAGIGRHGHSWHSEPEAGLYVSFVLRLALASDALPLVMLALGLAAQQAIAEVTGLAPDLRWPNDVLLDGKKCAGVLAHFEGDAVIAGIGINVSHTAFPPDIADLATSLQLAGARGVSREKLLVALVRDLEDSCKILAADGPSAICSAFTSASSYATGRRVRVEQSNEDEDGVLEGVTAGVDASGFLLLRLDNGTVTKILAGGVRRPDEGASFMLLALDAGNTNITIGAFQGKQLTGRWRLRTIPDQTPDEWGILMRNLFSLSALDLTQVHGVVISSVVPAVDQPLTAMAERYFERQPMFVTPSTDTGIKVLYDNPREVGADRIVNAVAGFEKYGGPCVIVDLGTTINFDVVSRNREFLGGVIAPGIGMSINGLFARTARLPMVDFREPEKLVGSNTVGSIQSGLYYGFLGLIDGIVERIAAQLGPDTKAIATGGQGQLIAAGSRLVKIFDQDLTLEGLRLIWDRNQPPK